MLRIYNVILDWLSELAPLIERIAHHDPDLARQLKLCRVPLALPLPRAPASGSASASATCLWLCRVPLALPLPLPLPRASAA